VQNSKVGWKGASFAPKLIVIDSGPQGAGKTYAALREYRVGIIPNFKQKSRKKANKKNSPLRTQRFYLFLLTADTRLRGAKLHGLTLIF